MKGSFTKLIVIAIVAVAVVGFLALSLVPGSPNGGGQAQSHYTPSEGDWLFYSLNSTHDGFVNGTLGYDVVSDNDTHFSLTFDMIPNSGPGWGGLGTYEKNQSWDILLPAGGLTLWIDVRALPSDVVKVDLGHATVDVGTHHITCEHNRYTIPSWNVTADIWSWRGVMVKCVQQSVNPEYVLTLSLTGTNISGIYD